MLVTLGWSKAGADGGGVIVVLAAFAMLAARLYDVRLTAKRVVLGIVACVCAVAALVGLDAATGGSSHVTRAVGKGPGHLAGELAHRVHISASSVTSGWFEGAVFTVSIVALVVLAARPPHFPAGDALLVGIAISLLVNDSPGDVASAAAISYAILWAFERVRRPTQRDARGDTVPVDAPGISAHT
jgi:hypothetical protein